MDKKAAKLNQCHNLTFITCCVTYLFNFRWRKQCVKQYVCAIIECPYTTWTCRLEGKIHLCTHTYPSGLLTYSSNAKWTWLKERESHSISILRQQICFHHTHHFCRIKASRWLTKKRKKRWRKRESQRGSNDKAMVASQTIRDESSTSNMLFVSKSNPNLNKQKQRTDCCFIIKQLILFFSLSSIL